MKNCFIDPRIEELNEEVNDVFRSERPEGEKKEMILALLAKWMEEGLELYVKVSDDATRENRHWDVQVMKDTNGKAAKRITAFTSDEVPFEMCMKGDFILYCVSPAWAVLKAVSSGIADQMELKSMEGGICLSRKEISEYFWKKE